MKIKRLFFVSLLAVVAALSAAACTTAAPVYATGAEKDKAAAAAAPLAQDILDGIQRNDYTLFSKDFDATMAKSLTQDSFATIVKKFSAYGDFKSSELVNVQIVSTYYRVNYQVTYAKEVITVGVVIPNNGTALVSGLWFN